jgi:hypothetical protein
MKKFLAIVSSVLLITFWLPTKSHSADLTGPKVSQRSSTSFVDATDDGVIIDVYYQVEDESGVDETRVPDTYIRLPGNESNTSLKTRPTLISGNIYNGSWLARFSYSKGIPPGIYVTSTSTWYDIQNNPSSIPANVTIRVDNSIVTSKTGTNIKPTDLKCNTPEQIFFEEEMKNTLSASLFCTFTVTSLRNGYKVIAYIDQIPANAPTPIFVHDNNEVIYPRSLTPTKIGKTFNLTNTVAGDYVLRINLEFLDFPDLTKSYSVKLSELERNDTPTSMPTTTPSACIKEGARQRVDGIQYVCVNNGTELIYLTEANAAPLLELKKVKIALEKVVAAAQFQRASLFVEAKKSKDKSMREAILGQIDMWDNFLRKYSSKEPSSEYVQTGETELAQLSLSTTKLIALSKKPNSITCIKGKTTKRVSGVNPKCPKGYKVKT